MKLSRLIFLFILSLQTISAQKENGSEFSNIDKKALQIPDSLTTTTNQIAKYIISNFDKDAEKSRAIFIWIASNIQYDIDNMFALNIYEKKEEKIAKALKTKKGICEDYAYLFNDICIKSGLKSFIVEGYTKQNGFVDYIPHAWCATLIDNNWFLFDPTWGSGYISGKKFIKKINNYYYKVQPNTLIKSHIPFDYLWQFLNYPITYKEFQDGKTHQNKTKKLFSFKDTIQVYEKQSYIDQLVSYANRIEKNGAKNSLVFNRLKYLNLEIENIRNNKTVNSYNAAVIDYNDAIRGLNEFINYKNKQFKPLKTDPEIQNMLDITNYKFIETKNKLLEISSTDVNTINMVKQLLNSNDAALKEVNEQQEWLKLYFSKSKLGRKSMFYKVTLFGASKD
jgi:hypothetical protein